MLFTDEDFKAMIMEKHLTRLGPVDDADNEEEGSEDRWSMIRDFHVSNGFIHDLKKRHGFSSRRPHYKRRPDIDPDRRTGWMQEIENLFQTIPSDRIYNADETSWRLYPTGVTTWAERGSENISSATSGNDKECLTVMATIRADGKVSRCKSWLVQRRLALNAARSEMLLLITPITRSRRG
jgi:hypothetical protein